MTEFQASRIVSMIYWKSFLEYFNTKKEVVEVEKPRKAKSLGRVKILKTETDSSKLESEAEKLSISLELL